MQNSSVSHPLPFAAWRYHRSTPKAKPAPGFNTAPFVHPYNSESPDGDSCSFGLTERTASRIPW